MGRGCLSFPSPGRKPGVKGGPVGLRRQKCTGSLPGLGGDGPVGLRRQKCTGSMSASVCHGPASGRHGWAAHAAGPRPLTDGLWVVTFDRSDGLWVCPIHRRLSDEMLGGYFLLLDEMLGGYPRLLTKCWGLHVCKWSSLCLLNKLSTRSTIHFLL